MTRVYDIYKSGYEDGMEQMRGRLTEYLHVLCGNVELGDIVALTNDIEKEMERVFNETMSCL